MQTHLRVVIAQLNLLVGDIPGNLKKHLEAATIARDKLSADVIVFSELSLTGYPPEDLLLRPAFIESAHAALQECIAKISGIYCVIGHPKAEGDHLYNACSVIYNHRLICSYAKQCLPNYSVFDEERYFKAGKEACVIPIKGIPVGILICEDLWLKHPTAQTVSHGAKIILSPNASPFEIDKHDMRLHTLKRRCQDNQIPLIYVNQVGGQDELIFDGGSLVIDAQGELVACAKFFEPELLAIDMTVSETIHIKPLPIIVPDKEEKIYQGLILGLKDYVEKNNFPSVLLGLSGGIDSALVLALAVDALGPERVRAISMPSRYTAQMSIDDAELMSKTLNVQYNIISIEATYQACLDSLSPLFKNKKWDITEENLQARARAIILMALSNQSGALVLTTGNRSEIAVGYCTLYGDMAGGFAPLKDVPKTLVYQLAAYRNQISPVIPPRIIERPPSAELAADQKDEDTLPPYSVLDQLLEYYLDQSMNKDDIIERGFDANLVNRIIKMIYRNEYKRRQSAIGPRIHHKSFSKDWRYPITNGFKE